MATEYASIEDIRAAYEDPIPASREPWVNNRIGEAHVRLRAAAPGLDERVSAGQLDAALVKSVLVNMVIRLLRNPKGYNNEHDGEYGYGYGQERGGTPGEIRPTDQDLEDLGYGSSTTYSTSFSDPTLPHAWRPDPCGSGVHPGRYR